MTEERLKAALSGQYRASLAMLREVIERCPDDQWAEGKHPRQFWRLALHTVYYTHLYLEIREEDFVRWEKDPRHRLGDAYFGPETEPISKADLLEYCDFVDALVDSKLAKIDLDSPESGFSWYSIPKLDHQILNIRHIMEHGGQLRDRLLERREYPEEHLDWIDIVPRKHPQDAGVS